MIVTKHAEERWKERFPELSMEIEWMRAARRLVGKKLRSRIKAACPAHEQFVKKGFKGFYYKVTPDFLVFVVTPPEKIITVFQLDKP